MTSTMQLLGAYLCLFLAAAYLLRRAWRTWFGGSSCGGDCCRNEDKTARAGRLITSKELTSRLRT